MSRKCDFQRTCCNECGGGLRRLLPTLAGLGLVLIAVGAAAHGDGEWTQWGGPNRDFSCTSTGLAEKWPADGPHKVWSQPIEYAHSTILVDGDRLYTMCRRGDQDAVLCLKAEDGSTVWETKYDAPTAKDMDLTFGPGPHSTPLIVGDRLFSVGAMVQVRCLNKMTGEILWSHDLMDEMGAGASLRGYGASPLAYQDLVIVNVGGAQTGMAAFKQDTGEVAWKSERFRFSYSSPLLVKFNDTDQLVAALTGDRLGLDPATGQTRWKTTVDSQSWGIMATPLWIPPDKLFCSAGYGGGTRLFQVKFADGTYKLDELWHYRKMQVCHGTLARVGDDMVVGSSDGSFGPAFVIAMDVKKGKPLWRQRGVAKANVLYADGKLILLDETGMLYLATVNREGMEIQSQVKILQEKAWSAPTLVGTRLYLRDYHTIQCLDLGATANP